MVVKYVLWYYKPTLIGAVAMCALFGVVTIVHVFRLLQTRPRFCIPFVVGGIFEAVGYGARAVAHYNTDKTMPYAIQSLLILLGPILSAASIYMILGRLIRSTGMSNLSIIRPEWTTRIFVGGDITCFLVQGAGGGILSGAKSQKNIDLGEHVILAGLLLQILVFGVFLIVAATFHLRARGKVQQVHAPWQKYLLLLYVISFLILGRNCYRVVEYGWGSGGYLLRHEWTLYAFDGAPMAIVLITSLLWYGVHFSAPQGQPTDLETKR